MAAVAIVAGAGVLVVRVVLVLARGHIGGQALQPHLVDAGAAVVHAYEAEVAQLLQARQVLGDGAARPAALVRQRGDAAKALLPLLVGVHTDGKQHRTAGAVQAVAQRDAAHQVDVDELLPWRGHGRGCCSHDWLRFELVVVLLPHTDANRWWAGTCGVGVPAKRNR